MKTICSILVLIIAIHSQCSARCLGADMKNPAQTNSAAEPPPCDHHTGNPSSTPSDTNSPQHHQNDSESCASVQSPQLKTPSSVKCPVECSTSEYLATLSPSLNHSSIPEIFVTVRKGSPVFSPPALLSVLRI